MLTPAAHPCSAFQTLTVEAFSDVPYNCWKVPAAHYFIACLADTHSILIRKALIPPLRPHQSPQQPHHHAQNEAEVYSSIQNLWNPFKRRLHHLQVRLLDPLQPFSFQLHLRANTSYRVRRVKCGEEKPLCMRCTSTGRKCDGYAPPKGSNSGLQDSIHKSISTTPTQDPMEQRLLYFFTTFTAPMLRGNFSPEFWERKVLQAAVAEPSIRHAVIAIGAIHEDFSSRLQIHDSDYEPPIQAFALRQYTKAIRHLHQLMATQAQQLDFTLLACILFICFDSLLGNQ